MKKKFLLLASVAAAVGLVGATFANFLVTDNANPFGVKVTPGQISTDKDTPVVLTWGTEGMREGDASGAGTAVLNIENIKAGETKGPYFAKVVAAVGSSDTDLYEGILSLSLTDNSGKAPTQERLIDHMKAFATTDELVEAPTFASVASSTMAVVPTSSGDLNSSLNIETNKGGKVVYFYVALEGVSEQVYDQIYKDVVYLQVDWSKGAGETVTSHPIHFDKGTATDWGDNTYVYAYYTETPTGTSSSAAPQTIKNAPWPGIKMEGGTYELDSKYTTIIFNNGEGGKQTIDIAMNDATHAALTSTSCYKISGTEGSEPVKYKGSWVAYVPPTPLTYSIVGKINGVTNWDSGISMELGSSTSRVEYVAQNVTFANGDEFKVKDSNGVWYPAEGGNITIAAEGGYRSAGVYNVYFAPNYDGDDGWFSYVVYLEAVIK